MQYPLPPPARYFPLEKGVYEVAPGLKTFGKDFGNGGLDQKVFQFDSSFQVFRESKLACRKDRLTKYYREHDYDPRVARGIAKLIISRLLQESPEHFTREEFPHGRTSLKCALTGETLLFDAEMKLLGESKTQVPYESAFDALAMQVQEDLNVVSLDLSGKNWLSAIHVCSPSSWRPEDKIGKDFIGVHSPVPQSEAMLKVSKAIVNGMVNKGPYVRFVWGLTRNSQPNHHPDAPAGMTQEQWRGKPLTSISDGGKFYMWVERQIVWGCPEVQASLFTIRASFNDMDQVLSNGTERELFKSTFQSMSHAVRDYKGIAEAADLILERIAQKST